MGGLGDLRAKFESFNWRVLETDGNNLPQLLATIEEAQRLLGQGQPIMVLMDTQMGYGVDFMMGSHKWHGVAPNDEQLEKALQQLSVEEASDY